MACGEVPGRLHDPFPAGSVLAEQSDPVQELPGDGGIGRVPSMRYPVTPSVTLSGSAPTGELRITSPAAAASSAATQHVSGTWVRYRQNSAVSWCQMSGFLGRVPGTGRQAGHGFRPLVQAAGPVPVLGGRHAAQQVAGGDEQLGGIDVRGKLGRGRPQPGRCPGTTGLPGLGRSRPHGGCVRPGRPTAGHRAGNGLPG